MKSGDVRVAKEFSPSQPQDMNRCGAYKSLYVSPRVPHPGISPSAYPSWTFTHGYLQLIRPLTYAPEIGAINSTPDSGASFSCRRTTSERHWLPLGPKAVNELEVVYRHEKLAPGSGVEFMAPISEASFWSVCQESYMHLPCSRRYDEQILIVG